MSLWICADCTTAYSVGAPACPHCSGTNRLEDGMPKIHADGSVTDAALDAELAAVADEAEVAPEAEPEVTPDVEAEPVAEQPTPRKRARNDARKG